MALKTLLWILHQIFLLELTATTLKSYFVKAVFLLFYILSALEPTDLLFLLLIIIFKILDKDVDRLSSLNKRVTNSVTAVFSSQIPKASVWYVGSRPQALQIKIESLPFDTPGANKQPHKPISFSKME